MDEVAQHEFVTLKSCDERHGTTGKQIRNVWSVVLVLLAAVIGAGSVSTAVAYNARQAVEIRKEVQSVHNVAVLESLKEIKAELILMRNGK